jgi:CIC family chloride channel protein
MALPHYRRWHTRILLWRSRSISPHNFLLINAVVLGIAAALAAFGLKETVRGIQWFQTQFMGPRVFGVRNIDWASLVYPTIGLLGTVSFARLLPTPLGVGIPGILYAIYRRNGLIPMHKSFSHLITAALTMGFGGSAGLEAPIVNTGTALGSNLGKFWRLDGEGRKVLIGCGAAAAISALFNSPISGVIFSLEMLALSLNIRSLIPILLSAVAANLMAHGLNAAEVILPARFDGEAYDFHYLPGLIAVGAVAALVSWYFTRSTLWLEERVERINNRWRRTLTAGAGLGILVFIFPALYGEGFGVIRSIMAGEGGQLAAGSLLFEATLSSPWILLAYAAATILAKVLATTLTISGGGNGGYFAPALFAGALTGWLVARVLNATGVMPDVDEGVFALVGMAGLIAGVMHAPFTAIFFIAEITQGYELIVPLMLVSAIAYLVNITLEPHSIFTKQLDRRLHRLMTDRDSRILHGLSIAQLMEGDHVPVREAETLRHLIDAVSRSRRNVFPVLDAQDHFRGIVQLDDIRAIMFHPELYDKTTVAELMKAPPAVVALDASMEDAMQLFEKSGAWNLPVLDGDRYAGMLSKSKIFNAYRSALAGS